MVHLLLPLSHFLFLVYFYSFIMIICLPFVFLQIDCMSNLSEIDDLASTFAKVSALYHFLDWWSVQFVSSTSKLHKHIDILVHMIYCIHGSELFDQQMFEGFLRLCHLFIIVLFFNSLPPFLFVYTACTIHFLLSHAHKSG